MTTWRVLPLCLSALVLTAGLSHAGPILTLEGDGFVMRWEAFDLTPEDLAVLAERRDHGWHLGWFKKRLRDLPDPAEPDFTPGGTGWPDFPVIPGTEPGLETGGAPPILPADQSAAPEAVPVSEPSSMALVGTGLFLLARRVRSKLSRKSGPLNG